MEEYQTHFNRRFYKDKKAGYWISIDAPKIRAHRWVWINIHGPIPKGYHIHHKNENKSDNRIENLELIEKSRHISHHMSKPERKLKSALICDKIRPLTKEWHSSKEGKAWHRLHALKCNFGKNDPKDYVCEVCKRDYQSSRSHNSRFCSNNCRSQYRRNEKLDHIQFKCLTCGIEFPKNRYQKTKYCSIDCYPKKQLISLDKRICEYCSKEFEVERYKKKRFCGYSCSSKGSRK